MDAEHKGCTGKENLKHLETHLESVPTPESHYAALQEWWHSGGGRSGGLLPPGIVGRQHYRAVFGGQPERNTSERPQPVYARQTILPDSSNVLAELCKYPE